MTKEVDGPESSVSSGQHARPLALSAPTSCVHEKKDAVLAGDSSCSKYRPVDLHDGGGRSPGRRRA